MSSHETTRWLIAPRPVERPRARVVLFPFAGAGGWQFRAWANDVPADVEFLAVQLPGREDRFRDPLLDTVEELATSLTAEIAKDSTPTVFLGVSCGARFAHLVAAELQSRRAPAPTRLVVVNSHPSHLPGPLTHSLGALSDDALLHALRSLTGAPEAFFRNEDLVRAFLPVVRRDIVLAESIAWDPVKRLTCEIVAIHGANDRDTSADDMTRWCELTTSGFDFREIDGGHFFPLADRNEWFDAVREAL